MNQVVKRKLDYLNRVVIPGDICNAFGWGSGAELEVLVSDPAAKAIAIREAAPCCSLCREATEELAAIERGYICPGCARKVR